MKRMKKKSLLLVAGIVLMLTIAIGGTIAYIVTNTTPVVNTFTPGEVPITIHETFDGETKSNVYVINDGNVPAYIRAKIIVTWKNEAGEVYWKQPTQTNDYEIDINTKDWKQGGSYGFYYYQGIVQPGDPTNPLINSCKMRDGANQPDGYTLSVEIIAESIQAEGMGATSAVNAFEKANQ